jgi:hypothetical protein
MATTSLNPGVGPTNADIATAVAAPSAATIATAVAAPSAATIAAAVAAPSAATIAAAVAAPSSATIATAVAAAVPTIGAINTSVANNAPSPFNYVHLVTGSLNNVNSATVSFSGYKYIKVIWSYTTHASANQQGNLRLNGDTGANYRYSFYCFNTVPAQTGATLLGATRMNMTSGSMYPSQAVHGYMEIENANSTNPKMLYIKNHYLNSSGYNETLEADGGYFIGSAITSVTIFDVNGNSFAADARNRFDVFGAN